MVMLSNVSFFEGSLEDDVVSGTRRGDYFFASFGNDTLSGLIGPDILRGSFGNDIINGGEGADGLQGGDDDDQLFGEQGNDNLLGSAGNDVLDGGDGNDVLSGGPGRDRLIGGAGADLFVFGETRESTPGAPDRIEDFAAEDHIDLSSIDGQANAAGGQSLSFIGSAAFSAEGQIRVAVVGGSTVIEINTTGASGADMAIELTNGAAFGAANLVLTGNPTGDFGSDEILVGDGGDLLAPVPAVDTFDGGGGEDYIYGGQLDDVLSGGADNDIVRAGPGNDILHGGQGHDVLDGSDGNDQLFGDDGIDTIRGQKGSDQLDGGEGNDFLDGGDSGDRLLGGGGDDILFGASGGDQLTGGGGSDTFLWTGNGEGRDTILDYEAGVDRFELDGILRNFNGSEAALAKYVRFVPSGSGSVLQVDSDGGGSGGWRDLALVQGQAGLDARSLFLSGDLVIDDVVPPTPRPFDALNYIASYEDLIGAFGANAAAGEAHYLSNGQAEGRFVSFDGLQYIASYGDLIGAFGANAAAGAGHYITNGFDEGRDTDSFNEVRYLANYADLQAAFGNDLNAATQHYITNGFAEGRVDFIL